jgi:hypothetical protein
MTQKDVMDRLVAHLDDFKRNGRFGSITLRLAHGNVVLVETSTQTKVTSSDLNGGNTDGRVEYRSR